MTSVLVVAGLIVALGLIGFFVERSRRVRHPVPAGLQSDISLPHQQEFELYHNALSLCSMKTRVCLAELQVDYRDHHIDLIETSCYENIRPLFLRINPAGTVPVLVHNGHPVYESHEQIRYAAQFAPAGAPALIPADPAVREQMDYWVDRSSLTDDPLRNADKSAGNAVPGQTLPLFATMVERIPLWRILEGLLFHFDRMRPTLFILLKLRGIHSVPGNQRLAGALANSRKHMQAHLDALETQLDASGGPWILGDQFTLADVSWLVICERLRQADAEHVFLEQRPAVAAWWDRIQQRPGFRQAIRGYSHPLIQYGTERIAAAKSTDPNLRAVLEGN